MSSTFQSSRKQSSFLFIETFAALTCTVKIKSLFSIHNAGFSLSFILNFEMCVCVHTRTHTHKRGNQWCFKIFLDLMSPVSNFLLFKIYFGHCRYRLKIHCMILLKYRFCHRHRPIADFCFWQNHIKDIIHGQVTKN